MILFFFLFSNQEDQTFRFKNDKLLKLFQKACAKHDELMNEARQNEGCDRHLLGLMLISKQLNVELPEIYTDVSWKKSGGGGNFLISSSCLGYTSVGGTCAPFCTDGYTMIYNFADEGLTFGLVRYKDSSETDLEKMAASLDAATLQTQLLFEKTNSKI
jgi:carnitine O-octanoyltransferase